MIRLRHAGPALAGLLASLAVVAVSGTHVRPASAAAYRQPAPSLFGINTGTFQKPCPGCYAQDFLRAKRLGARWVHFTGDSIHWSGGRPNYGALDYGVQQARKNGLGILISLGGDPRACSIKPTPSDYTNCPPTTPHDLRVYRHFLRQELTRYRGSVTYFESWVEPNHANRWPPKPNPAQYARLLKAQYSVFEAVNGSQGTHLKLLFADSNGFSIEPGSSSGMAVLPFTHAVLNDLGGAHVFDGIALHAYRYPPVTEPPSALAWDNVRGIPAASGANGPYPAEGCDAVGTWCRMTWRQELSAYEQEFENHGYPQEPLWLSEFGWPGSTSVPSGQDPRYFPTYAQQKQDLSEAYTDLLGLKFVQAAFWFNLRDYEPGVPNPDPPFFAHFGLMTWNARLKPAGRAFKRLVRAHPHR